MSLSFRSFAAGAALLSVATVAVGADEALEDVIVTASRVEQSADNVIGSVTVITREDIERRQVQSLTELLRGETSVDITNSGGLGKGSSIFLRGASSTQTLILVDGVRIGSVTAGATSVEFLPVEQIERIEIVRGPRSSLYGSDAIGGVIQIFTRKAQGVNATLGWGTYDTRNVSASAGLRGDKLRFNVSGNYLSSTGFNACNDAAGCYTTEPDRDGFRNSSATVHAGYRLNEVVDAELSALYAQGYTEYDGSYGNQTRFVQSTPTFKLRLTPTDAWTLALTTGVTHDKIHTFADAQPSGSYDSRKDNVSLQSDWTWSAHTFTVGADYLDDVIHSDTVYEQTSRNNTGVFAQYLGQFKQLELSASLRRDDNEQFGNHSTGNVGVKWFFNDALAFNAGWGSAFHAPNFNDLYYPGYSNAHLDPETSRSVEAGLTGKLASSRWSLQGFETQTRSLIGYDASFLPINISKARLRGIEATARTQWGQAHAAASYTYLSARSRGDDANYNHLLPRRARNAGRVELGYDWSAFQLGTTLNVVGARFDNLANTSRMGGYTTTDITGKWLIDRHWSLQAKLANAFDHRYETVRYYNQPGRTASLYVNYQLPL